MLYNRNCMGRRCCIAGCPSTSRLAAHHGVTYHAFPLDATTRAIWMKNTRLNPGRNITKSVLVCSRHFRRNDFQPIRNGKYLLKPRVFPTVFPWGKVDAATVDMDMQLLANPGRNSANASIIGASTNEDETKATVAATVAQILAETAELNAAIKSAPSTSSNISAISKAFSSASSNSGSATSATNKKGKSGGVSPTAHGKYEPATSFFVGARLEALDNEYNWVPARIAAVENDKIQIRFDRSNKKPQGPNSGTTEWIAKDSQRMRQRVNTRPVPKFKVEERCMARWSGPRKFPGIVKRILDNGAYEVLFDDGYTKNVRALHMTKMEKQEGLNAEPSATLIGSEIKHGNDITLSPSLSNASMSSASPKLIAASSASSSGGSNKKRATHLKRDWPLLDMSNLDINSLNLPAIPQDGEWTCHWVNDQPIGKESFLIVGEHRKPTVVVEDWRLPKDWIKHMYQRSNVLGKWDVILVSPSGKRFRSKSDLKTYLEELGQVYNPDIYDFSIHRRRAKDINAYVYTKDYVPQVIPKPKLLDISLDTTLSAPKQSISVGAAAATSTPLPSKTTSSQYMETPVATLMPPIELMSPQANGNPKNDKSVDASALKDDSGASADTKLEDGFATIGNLKVQIIDNLFRCPKEGCFKNFRKEDHVQIHIKHYHEDLAKLLNACPKMQELAVKRTHPTSMEQHNVLPKNQIPNQQFFAKLHQQDMQHSRSHRRTGTGAGNATPVSATSPAPIAPTTPTTSGVATVSDVVLSSAIVVKSEIEMKEPVVLMDIDDEKPEIPNGNVSTTLNETESPETLLRSTPSPLKARRPRFNPNKRISGARKSNRQRTTRRYLIPGQSKNANGPSLSSIVTGDSSAVTSEVEDTRASGNTTPDVRPSDVKRRRIAATTPVSSIDSPATADSGSTQSHEVENVIVSTPKPVAAPQYIKENGELIKIVRMRQEEIINCICAYGEEDGLMVQCELCLCWQHGTCNGIMKESDVPDKYVCYICRNPNRGRDSMRFKHDQDWLYEGKLPVANYHRSPDNLSKLNDLLKRSHTLTGNLIEAKRFMHSLKVKINIANNRVHPKLYLWAKPWDEDQKAVAIKTEMVDDQNPLIPNIPQPEAAIDPEECQVRLIEHVKIQQGLLLDRLNEIEVEVAALEKEDDLPDLKDADLVTTKEALSTYIKELETVKQIAKINTINNMKESLLKEQQENTFI